MRELLSRWGLERPRTRGSKLVKPLACALVAFVAFGACSDSAGTTPDCTFNVDSAGIHPLDGGCEQYPVCDAGDPVNCCPDGGDMAACLAAFGVGVGDAGAGGGSTGSGGAGGAGGH